MAESKDRANVEVRILWLNEEGGSMGRTGLLKVLK